MRHTLSNFAENRNGNPVADCSVCGPRVRVLRDGMHKKGVCWKGYDDSQREKRAERRIKARNRLSMGAQRKRERKAAERVVKQEQEYAAWLWRQICYARAENRCEICGKECAPGVFGHEALHAHHVIKRSQSARLQLDPANSMAVCAPHHQGADRDQIKCLAILEEREPGIAAYLLSERRKIGRISFDEEMDRLRKVAAIYNIEVERAKSSGIKGGDSK